MITMTGHSWPIPPIALTSRNSGITSTVLGITMVSSVMNRSTRRPLKRSIASAYPAGMAVNTASAVPPIATISELTIHVVKMPWLNDRMMSQLRCAFSIERPLSAKTPPGTFPIGFSSRNPISMKVTMGTAKISAMNVRVLTRPARGTVQPEPAWRPAVVPEARFVIGPPQCCSSAKRPLRSTIHRPRPREIASRMTDIAAAAPVSRIW